MPGPMLDLGMPPDDGSGGSGGDWCGDQVEPMVGYCGLEQDSSVSKGWLRVILGLAVFWGKHPENRSSANSQGSSPYTRNNHHVSVNMNQIIAVSRSPSAYGRLHFFDFTVA